MIPIIVGPTASGKSDLAMALARLAESMLGRKARIITADAYQVYIGMDIGTAKPTKAERDEIPHHLLDLIDPIAQHDAAFTAQDWLKAAKKAQEEITAEGHVPIFVGGTSLYIQSLIFGMFEGPPADPDIRARLAGLKLEDLRQELERVDPAAALRIHPNDTRRSIRAIEVFELTGKPISAHQTQWANPSGKDEYALFILNWPVSELNLRINGRVKAMMQSGLLEEVRGLLERADGKPDCIHPQAREALGYKQLIEHLENPRRVQLDEAVEKIKIETRRFAKNQRTWMKRLGLTPGSIMLDAATMTREQMLERIFARLKEDRRGSVAGE